MENETLMLRALRYLLSCQCGKNEPDQNKRIRITESIDDAIQEIENKKHCVYIVVPEYQQFGNLLPGQYRVVDGELFRIEDGPKFAGSVEDKSTERVRALQKHNENQVDNEELSCINCEHLRYFSDDSSKCFLSFIPKIINNPNCEYCQNFKKI